MPPDPMPARCLLRNDSLNIFSLQTPQLMGKERNVPLTERSNKQLHYYDDEICKFTLCGLCPYTLFSNTKSFLGE